MGTRLRVVLPSVAGGLSFPLILWDIHNTRVIESVGMGWDTGAPIWPYQAADILLHLVNGPAYSIAMPIANWLRLVDPIHFLVVLPAIPIWWFFLGLVLDRGLSGWTFLGMAVVLVALLSWAATTVLSIFRLRLDDQDILSAALLIVRFLTPLAWLIALTSFLLARAKQVVPFN